MNTLIKKFSETTLKDVPVVGGKNASLGEMLTTLRSSGIKVPDGFATTTEAFWMFIDHNDLRSPLRQLMDILDRSQFSNLREIGERARKMILQGSFPEIMAKEIVKAYEELRGEHMIEVAVRSSATAEDLPNASFAGQHESFLNIKGNEALLNSIRKCFASLYTDRAIKYREDKKFDHNKIALSVGVQKMVRSDKACSGIGFTLEPESGFRNVIHLSGVWGLGENIVQGFVIPDEYILFKPALAEGKNAILQKKLGSKEKTMVYSENGITESTINLDTPVAKREIFVLNDQEIQLIGKWALKIEEHYEKPMDIEWAKDGLTGEIYIIQARPETVHSQKNQLRFIEYSLKEKHKPICAGQAIGSKVVSGTARILQSPSDADLLRQGEIVVTKITSPDWDTILKKSGGIITNKGGRTSHASIVARELGVPAIVGTGDATAVIKDGETVTISCCEGKTGYIYRGIVPYQQKEIDFSNVQMPESTEVMLIASDPETAFKTSLYPNDGVGLMRIEFIITHNVKVHPMALVKFDDLKSQDARDQIESLTHHYSDKKKYFIEKLAQGIATIAAAFYPKDVIVRMSDFKSNEYANLVGGKEFEPEEENPMIGFRGASRYYSPLYKEGFELECKAINMVREEMGLINVKVMIPFCRTPQEGRKVVEVMKNAGLDRDVDKSLEIYVMAEIPSNVLEAEEFASIFDGFSIGSNDLTQLTLGIDRDSALVADLFNEQNKSALAMISMVIDKAKSMGVRIGLCGQAPSDYPEFAGFLVGKGINSISFNPDAVLKGIENIKEAEKKLLIEM